MLKYDDEESLKAAIDVIEHTRGFKNSETNEQNEPPHRRIIENILPSGKTDVVGDPLRKAMGLE